MIERMDDMSRLVTLEGPARRIVCLVPSITETLFSVGAGDHVVGITDFCIHPAEGVKTVSRVGGTKNFSAARALELEPDLVIANAEENRKHEIERLERAGLQVFVTFPKSIDGCVKMIEDVAALTGTQGAAAPLLDAIGKARTEALARAPALACRVLCPIWKNPYMTVSRDTYVDSVIRGCGGVNVFEDAADRYPRFELREGMDRRPDVILLPTEPYRFAEGDITDIADTGKNVPAVRNGRIHIVEGELLSWYGPRLPRALQLLSELFSRRSA